MFTRGHLRCFESPPSRLAMTVLLLLLSARTFSEVDASSECFSGRSDNQWTVQTTVTFTAPGSNKVATESEECMSQETRTEKTVLADPLDKNSPVPRSFPEKRVYVTPQEAVASRETTTEQRKYIYEVEPEYHKWWSFRRRHFHPVYSGTPASLETSSEEDEATTEPSTDYNGYRLFEGLGYYKLHSTKKTWLDANQTCEDEGGHLVIINSKEEELAVVRLVKFRIGMYDFAFIGINDLQEEGNFMTVLGEPLSSIGYANWADGEPNNAAPGEDCGSMRTTGKINDFFCEAKRSFVCEIPLDSYTDNML